MRILGLRIHVDTRRGYREGVPRLLDLMDELGARGSFFFGMGTEGSGSMVSRVLGQDGEIVASAPGILRDVHRRGQDCGVCGWNPLKWQTHLDKMKDTTLEAEIRRSVEHFTQRTGIRPSGFASPGFRVNYMSLRSQDEARFKYCSDTFGLHPYRPKISWKTFSTPQIPATVPPLETILKKKTASEAERALGDLAEYLPEGLSVLPMSAIVAAATETLAPLHGFLSRCRAEGVRFVGLDTVARSLDPDSLPICEVVNVCVSGMPQEVGSQSLE